MCRRYTTASKMRLAVLATTAAAPVTTSNIHKAKGGEWKHVIVYGVTEGVLPDFRARSVAKLEQERNALFVAITRASETLALVHTPGPVLRGRGTPLQATAVSRFLRRRAAKSCVDEIL